MRDEIRGAGTPPAPRRYRAYILEAGRYARASSFGSTAAALRAIARGELARRVLRVGGRAFVIVCVGRAKPSRATAGDGTFATAPNAKAHGATRGPSRSPLPRPSLEKPARQSVDDLPGRPRPAMIVAPDRLAINREMRTHAVCPRAKGAE